MPSRRYLYLTAFAGGLVSLAVEMAASHLLRPYFGSSNLVWAPLIGLILLYLTAGYFIGGRWADRSPRPATLYQIVAWAAFLVGLVPFAARPVLTTVHLDAAGFDIAVLLGSFAAVLLLFSLPVTLLGCVSPFIIRLALADVRSAGRVAGRVYAISTAGSFAGTFLPLLLLALGCGTRDTFVLLALLLLLVALGGLALSRPRLLLIYLWLPLLLLLLAFSRRGQPVRSPDGLIFETESPYNYIQVLADADGCRRLLLDDGAGVQSVYCPDPFRPLGVWDYFLVAPYFNPPPYPPERVAGVAIVGLAAGTVARQYTAVYGPLPIDGAEIDPAIVRVGREYFALDDLPNLRVFVADGRYFLSRSDRRYTVIVVDAYRATYIPSHLATVEFFRLAREHLTDDGVLAVNVAHARGDYRLVESLAGTLAQVFPAVHVVAVPESFNTVVVGTVRPTAPTDLAANLPLLDGRPLLATTARQTAANLLPLSPGGLVFTDDHPLAELLTDAMVVDFALDSSRR